MAIPWIGTLRRATICFSLFSAATSWGFLKPKKIRAGLLKPLKSKRSLARTVPRSILSPFLIMIIFSTTPAFSMSPQVLLLAFARA